MYDVIIIGAGIVGSSTAYYLSQYNMRVALLEADNDVANGTTKANSAIMHAGYDPKPGTLMAKYNVEGSKMAKDLCQKLSVPYKNDGALVLAFNNEDLETVNKLYKQGLENGVEQLYVLNKEETYKVQPNLSEGIVGALYAKTSAIVSPWEFALALAEVAVKNGVELFLNNKVIGIKKNDGVFIVTTDKSEYECKYIVNAAGVHADKIHELIGEKEFTIYPTRGQYYLLDKCEGAKVQHTLFQCPNKDGKGVVVIPTVHGNMLVGPDSEVMDDEAFGTTAAGLAFIKEKASKTMDSINYRENIRNFAGVRARSDRGDFIIEESKSVENFYNLAGMASPALTSGCAIGYHVIDWLQTKQTFQKKDSFVETREKVRFKELSDNDKNELIKKNPSYGRVICRCETITEGEILETFNTPIPPQSIDAVKRRTNAGMGRCQGGFCGEKVAMILKEKLNIEFSEILQDHKGSNILVNKAKEGKY